MAFDYDLYVLGAGSGGVRASRIAAGLGARVAVAESYRVGGTCVIRGCVPKKLLVYASHIGEDIHAAKGYGWTVEGARFDWADLIERKDKEIDRLNGLYLKTLDTHNVTLHQGEAKFIDRHTVEVNGKRYTAEKILIAVGGWPQMPDIPGIEHAISSNEALHLKDFPQRIAIVGGGYIAVEFAGIFGGMGADVSLLYRGEQILRGFDRDLSDRLATEMTKKGITVRTGINVSTIVRQKDESLILTLSDGTQMTVDQVMYATGRRPNTKNLGLDQIGVDMDASGAVKVNEYSRTNIDNIFAVGDVTNRIQLTPVAIKEGHAFALTEFGNTPIKPEYNDVPSAVFSQPPIGTVGLTEDQARQHYGDVDVYASDFRPMKHTLSGLEERSFTKLIVDPVTDKVVGAHMIGMDAAEIIQGIGIAVKAGVTKAQFDATIAVHPSSAEEFVLMREKRLTP